MSVSFPHVKRRVRGYRVDEVDSFITVARSAYDSPIAGVETLTSQAIRATSFGIQKGGYSTTHVDAALERLETAFADRERAIVLATQGEDAVIAEATELAATLTARFDRKPRHRFRRVSVLAQGYAPKDVDAFTDRLAEFMKTGSGVTIADIRAVTFRSALGGYEEAQVDAVLDALIELLLSLGNN